MNKTIHLPSQLFYINTIEACLETEQKGALIKAYLGKSKDSLDAIDLEIDIKDSVSAFGPFIKFIIGDRSTITNVPGPSVFEVLMSAQRITSLPKRTENVCEKLSMYKQQLFRGIHHCLSLKGLHTSAVARAACIQVLISVSLKRTSVAKIR